MGKLEFRVARNERAYIARDKLFRHNLEREQPQGNCATFPMMNTNCRLFLSN
jgi:hypothetical protein